MIRYIILTLLGCAFLHANYIDSDGFPTRSVSYVLREPGANHRTLTEPQQYKILELVQQTLARVTFLDAYTLSTPIALSTDDIESIARTFRNLQLEMEGIPLNGNNPQFETRFIKPYHDMLFNSLPEKHNPAPIATFVADTLSLTYAYATLEDYLSRAQLHPQFIQQMNNHLRDARTAFLWFSMLDAHVTDQDDIAPQLMTSVCDFYKHPGASFDQKETLIHGLRYVAPTVLWPEENHHYPPVSQQILALISEDGPLAGQLLPVLKTTGLHKTDEGEERFSTTSDLIDLYAQTFQLLTSS